MQTTSHTRTSKVTFSQLISEKGKKALLLFSLLFFWLFFLNLNFKFFSVGFFRGFGRLYYFLFCLFARSLGCSPPPLTITHHNNNHPPDKLIYTVFMAVSFFIFFFFFFSFFEVGQQHSTKLHSQLFFFFITKTKRKILIK